MSTTTMDLEHDLALLMASDPIALSNPFPVWKRVRDEGRIYRHNNMAFMTQYSDVRPWLMDEARLSNRWHNSGSRAAAINEALDPDDRILNREVSEFESAYMNRSDGDVHSRLRETVHRAFTPRRLAELKENVATYTEEALTEAAAQEEVDFVSLVSSRIPVMVVADMLGVPQSDRDQVLAWSDALGLNRGGADPVALRGAHEAMLEFRAYVEEEIIPARRLAGGSALVRALLDAEEGSRLSQREVAAQFVVLLFAGVETTANLLSIGLHALLGQREQWELMCGDPSLVRNGVEELLRWVSPAQFVGRVALEPIDIGDDTIETGETIFLLLASANRDPAEFDTPDVLDIRRQNARGHVAFGLGPHFCLGGALTRIEAEAVFGQLVTRFPKIELGDDDPTWGSHPMLRALRRLPVRPNA